MPHEQRIKYNQKLVKAYQDMVSARGGLTQAWHISDGMSVKNEERDDTAKAKDLIKQACDLMEKHL